MIDLETAKNDALAFTRYVTTKWDDRLTGSQACLETGEYIYDELAKYTDTQYKQPFETHPEAFLGFIRVCIVLFIINAAGLWGGYLPLSIVVTVFSLVIFVGQFLLYWELLEPFYPKKQSQNIYAILEPSETPKQQIFVTAHHDSAYVFQFLEKNAKYYNLIVNAGIGSMLVIMLLTLVVGLGTAFGWDVSFFWTIAKYASLVLALPVLYLWRFRKNKGTPGAGDNMICTAVTLEILKFFYNERRAGRGLAKTRIVIGSWDAEEAGLRGARAFVKTHRAMLEEIPGYNFNFECLYDHKELHAQTSDINSFVKLSEQMATDCVEVAAERGYTIRKLPFPLLAGGTDAGEFAKAGIEAVTLSALNFANKGDMPAYHTTRDTIESVDPVAVSQSIDIAVHYILKKERELFVRSST